MGNNIDERRVAKVMCHITILTQLLTADPILRGSIESNAPKDLKVIGIDQSFHNYLNGKFEIYFTSKSNHIVPEGDMIPTVAPFIITEVSDVKTD